ncbi:MAG TPA: hypothetical protein VG056_12465 [Pirellulales bacterium]|nr:hypothetical protein [Pirellulales bacterium]
MYFEVSEPENGINDFVVTAGGKRELFSLVDCIVAMAPRLDGWTFTALKPPMGFDFVTEHGGIKLDPRKLWFLPLTGGPSGDDLGLRIGIPGLSDVDKKAALFAAWMLLDTAIGERKMAVNIQHVEVVALPNDPSGCGYIALSKLREYLDRRDSRSH